PGSRRLVAARAARGPGRIGRAAQSRLTLSWRGSIFAALHWLERTDSRMNVRTLDGAARPSLSRSREDAHAQDRLDHASFGAGLRGPGHRGVPAPGCPAGTATAPG